MNTIIKHLHIWLKDRPKTKEWLWFLLLWFGGLIGVTLLAYPVKWAMLFALL